MKSNKFSSLIPCFFHLMLAPAFRSAPCSALSRRSLYVPASRSGSRSRTSRLLCSLPPLPPSSRRSLPPHAPAAFSLPPLVQLPIISAAPAAQSLLTRRTSRSPPTLPLRDPTLRRDQRRHFQPAAHTSARTDPH